MKRKFTFPPSALELADSDPKWVAYLAYAQARAAQQDDGDMAAG